MANTFQITGASADLCWGYHSAGRLGAWSVSREGEAWTFTATILTKDDFRLSQRPLVVVTPNGWKWRVNALQISGQTLTASLSPQESTDGESLSIRSA